jgi:hypothetical protein
MQRHQPVIVKANQNARRAVARQIGSHFPQTLTHRTAQRHPDRPSPLRPQQVSSNGTAVCLIQAPQPVANRLAAYFIAEEYEFDLPGVLSEHIYYVSNKCTI